MNFNFFLFSTYFSEERWITSILERKIWNSNDKVIYSVAADDLILFAPWIICGTVFKMVLLHLNFTATASR